MPVLRWHFLHSSVYAPFSKKCKSVKMINNERKHFNSWYCFVHRLKGKYLSLHWIVSKTIFCIPIQKSFLFISYIDRFSWCKLAKISNQAAFVVNIYLTCQGDTKVNKHAFKMVLNIWLCETIYRLIFFFNMNMIFFNFIEKRDFIEIVENLCSLDKNQC